MNLIHLTPKAAEAEALLKTLANRHRLLILCELSQGERSVGDLQQSLALSQSSLSQHLARLRADQLVTTRRAQQAIFYSLADDDVMRIVTLLHDLYCQDAA